MSYIEENLMPNEKILYKAQVNPFIFTPAVISFLGCITFTFGALAATNQKTPFSVESIFSYLFVILFLLLKIRVGFDALIIMLTTEFAITNKRIVAKTGFVHRRTLEMLIPKIESVSVYQNILGRVMNFGSVTITGTVVHIVIVR